MTSTDIISVDTEQAKSRGERNSNHLVVTLQCVDTTKLDCMGQWMTENMNRHCLLGE